MYVLVQAIDFYNAFIFVCVRLNILEFKKYFYYKN